MYHEISKHFLKPTESHFIMPLAVDVIAPDSYLYLAANRNGQWFVIAEADYMPGLPVVEAAETVFPVKVTGWHMNSGTAREDNIMPLERIRMSTAKDWTDEDWGAFRQVTIQNESGTFAMLAVEPLPGVTYKDFNLSFYAQT